MTTPNYLDKLADPELFSAFVQTICALAKAQPHETFDARAQVELAVETAESVTGKRA